MLRLLGVEHGVAVVVLGSEDGVPHAQALGPARQVASVPGLRVEGRDSGVVRVASHLSAVDGGRDAADEGSGDLRPFSLLRAQWMKRPKRAVSSQDVAPSAYATEREGWKMGKLRRRLRLDKFGHPSTLWLIGGPPGP